MTRLIHQSRIGRHRSSARRKYRHVAVNLGRLDYRNGSERLWREKGDSSRSRMRRSVNLKSIAEDLPRLGTRTPMLGRHYRSLVVYHIGSKRRTSALHRIRTQTRSFLCILGARCGAARGAELFPPYPNAEATESPAPSQIHRQPLRIPPDVRRCLDRGQAGSSTDPLKSHAGSTVYRRRSIVSQVVVMSRRGR